MKPTVPPLVAQLSAPAGQVNLLASYEGADRPDADRSGSAGKPEKSLELWLLPEGGTPKSLGIFARERAAMASW